MRTVQKSLALSRLLTPMPVFAAAFAAALLPLACENPDPDPQRTPEKGEPSSEAASLARSLKASFPAAFAPSEAPHGATVTLPEIATDPIKLRDNASSVEVSITLAGASATRGAAIEDVLAFPGAAPEGGDLVLRTLPEGVEDLVHFTRRPNREALEYILDTGTAGGLRLVGGVLEVLDKKGIPVLRAAAPYVLDASGRHEAALSVEGCAVDTSPVAPFGRAVTAPGADFCTVKVDWAEAHVAYPALIDPVWGSTFNTMAAARVGHTITLLNPNDPKSLALVVGGVSSVGGAPLKSAEIYDPLSRRFSNTGLLAVGRTDHSATLLTTIVPPGGIGQQKPVLVAGGKDAAGDPLASLEVYDPASGTFVADAQTMAMPRFDHAAVLVDDNVVLLAGGTAPPLNQPTNTAYLYTFTGFGAGTPPGSVTSSLNAVADLMESARTGLAATRVTTGEVLLTGGFVLAGGALQALQSGELFDPATSTFGPIVPSGTGVAVMVAQRGYHASTALAVSGTVLVTGGLSKTTGGIYTNTVDLYLDGSNGTDKGFLPQPVPITMAAGRSNHSATLLPDGRVLIAGGFNGSSALGSSEVFDPTTSAFSDLGALVPMSARGDHAALLVNAGDSVNAGHTVLVTGGSNASGAGAAALSGAQILLRVNGDPCTIADDCLSGFCSDGVCCDTACDEECYACSAATKQTGVDGVCGYASQGSDPHVQCINQVETHTQCDGKGSTEQTEDTKSCIPAACGADGYCSPGCTITADCDKTGWCNLQMPGDMTPGTCSQKKVNGAPCYGDDQCISASCVDGVCCETSCDQQCQACDLPGFVGTCQLLGADDDPQDVHPNSLGMSTSPREACDGFIGESGTERTSCTGACTGKSQCEYPVGDVYIQLDDCTDDPAGGPSQLLKYPCDGMGSNTEDPQDCVGFLCADAHTCKTTCTTDADCIDDFVCASGACTELTGPLCDGVDTLRQPKALGGSQLCPGNYACPAGATACLTACDSIEDCVTRSDDPVRFVCNGAHQCLEEPPVAELPGCSLGSGTGESGRSAPWWLIVGIGALFAAARRRNRSAGISP